MEKPDKPLLTIVPSTEPFFYELITQSIDHQNIDVSPPAVHYVTALLAHRLTHSDEMNDTCSGTLVDILKASLENPDKRMELTKDLGETALVISGIFYDYLLRHCISPTYYIEMGQQAYDTLAGLSHPLRTEVYDEIARKFPGIVCVLNEVADRTFYHREEDIARTYERWLESGSDVFFRRLIRNGIPLQIKKEKNRA